MILFSRQSCCETSKQIFKQIEGLKMQCFFGEAVLNCRSCCGSDTVLLVGFPSSGEHFQRDSVEVSEHQHVRKLSKGSLFVWPGD
jgi:hypothetical protein